MLVSLRVFATTEKDIAQTRYIHMKDRILLDRVIVVPLIVIC